MRNYLIVLALLLAGSTASAATHRHGGLSEFQPVQAPQKLSPEEARKKAAGIKDVQGFGTEKIQKEPPFPWRALGFSLVVLLLCAPFARKLYRSTQKDLTDQATFGLQAGSHASEGKRARSGGKHPPSRRAAAAAAAKAGNETRILSVDQVEQLDQTEQGAAEGARDAVWDAISSTNDWVGADWVAKAASLSTAQAADEIGALVEEGYLEEASDKAGKSVYRIAAA